MPLRTYRQRRQVALELTEQHLFGQVPLLFLGCDETTLRRDRQDPWIDYYSGCAEPEAALLIEQRDGKTFATLFLDPGDPARVIWDGPRLGPGPQSRRVHGVEDTQPLERLEAAVAAVLNNKAGRHVTIHLRGGDLEIEWRAEDNHVYMTGPAVEVFSGEWST